MIYVCLVFSVRWRNVVAKDFFKHGWVDNSSLCWYSQNTQKIWDSKNFCSNWNWNFFGWMISSASPSLRINITMRRWNINSQHEFNFCFLLLWKKVIKKNHRNRFLLQKIDCFWKKYSRVEANIVKKRLTLNYGYKKHSLHPSMPR